MYNPYEQEMMRRRQQTDIPIPQFQQPAPVTTLPLYAGPALPQWTPMEDNNEHFQNAGKGMAELVKRFRRPNDAVGLGQAVLGGAAKGL